MKKLTIPRLSIKDVQDITHQEQALNALPKQAVAETPWQSYPYKPAVHFAMGYHDKHIYLKYFVSEKAIRATTNQVNGKYGRTAAWNASSALMKQVIITSNLIVLALR